MRIATLGLLAVLASASAAAAADLDYGYLRGAEDDYAPAPVIDWSGFYVGGHGGYSSAGLGFGNSFQPIVANALRHTAAENEMQASSFLATQSKHVNATTFGALVGYNVQFDDVVFGIEADYTYFGKSASSFDSIGRISNTSDGYLTGVALAGEARTEIKDYGSIRGRLGYAFGPLLPYVTGGVAVGRATVSDTVSIQNYGYDRATYISNLGSANPAVVNHFGYASFDEKNPGTGVVAPGTVYGSTKRVTVGGVALGAGLEFALTSNILLRGEYQYVLFNDFKGHSAEINTVRGGAAVKF
ncbi:outer membrane protein [Methylorubrum salsuginis]|uniref:Opacity protein n=1 Tax=Methylorubrum salsuginis TaxID=414703 RepID=A0A1I4F546_9HYPH|nr:outer membrane beta-barrel protein [Methylorubrum salsuginis]SFL12410.1 Opacity protein [Methylorubrum salsuginis]